MNSAIGRCADASAYVWLNAWSASLNASLMYSSPRIWNQWLVRRPSGSPTLSETTSLTTSNETIGFVALPNLPNLSLRYLATLLTCVRRRSRMICLSAAELVRKLPWSSWKNQSGVCWYQTSVWPCTRRPFACA